MTTRRQFIGSAIAATLSGCGGGSGGTTAVPSMNIVFDGNSLTYGAAEPPMNRVSAPYPQQVVMGAPNLGVRGATWATMMDHPVDALLMAGAVNVIVAWETTSTVADWYDAAGVGPVADFVAANAAGATEYLQARRRAGWGRVVLLSSIPREAVADLAWFNDTLLACDADMAANYRAYGATDYVNVRAGPLAFTDWETGFDALAAQYGDGGFWLPAALEPPGARVHLADGGYEFVAAAVREAL